MKGPDFMSGLMFSGDIVPGLLGNWTLFSNPVPGNIVFGYGFVE